MKRTRILAILLFVCARAAQAQDDPKADLFVGYSFVRLGGLRNFPAGYHVSLAGSIKEEELGSVALVGEFTRHHQRRAGVRQQVNTFTFGCRSYLYNSHNSNFFGHATLGLARLRTRAGVVSPGQTKFALTIGGGYDRALTRRLALRTQVDFVNISTRKKGFRYSGGLLFYLGGK